MGQNSKIEWTDATWNPVDGCTPVLAGRKHCWARRFSRRTFGSRPFSEVRVHPERLDQPLRWRKARRVAVCLMGDLFHGTVPGEFIDQIFSVMAGVDRRFTFQILTKRAERMCDYLNTSNRWKRIIEAGESGGRRFRTDQWPLPHVYGGVSIEDQPTADARVYILLQTNLAVRFVNYEPALAPVKLWPWLYAEHPAGSVKIEDLESPMVARQIIREALLLGRGLEEPYPEKLRPRIDWVIAGGESGPGARPSHPDWFRAVRDQCQAAGVPFFFKQWGEWEPIQWHDGKMPLLKISVPIYPDDREALAAKEIVMRHGTADANLRRVGKKRAGRLLDGREWNEFPRVTSL
jgi:protein gp37